MKGLILAGGKGTRLLPITKLVNKHMVPILNRPMITYPLETLRSLKIKDIMIVSGGDHIGDIAEFLGDGSDSNNESDFDVRLTYKVQKEAGGIAQALGLAKDFVGNDAVAVILGDNIYGVDDLMMRIGETEDTDEKFVVYPPPEDIATIVVKKMKGAERFGVLVGENFVKNHKDHYRIIEKPKDITEGDVVTGLYIYPPDVFDIIPKLQPSARGELEITSVNNYFLSNGRCRIMHLQEQDFWSDAGTVDSLYEATKWAYEHR